MTINCWIVINLIRYNTFIINIFLETQKQIPKFSMQLLIMSWRLIDLINDSFKNVRFDKILRLGHLYSLLYRDLLSFIPYFCNVPFSDIVINYLVSGGFRFFSLYMYVFSGYHHFMYIKPHPRNRCIGTIPETLYKHFVCTKTASNAISRYF